MVVTGTMGKSLQSSVIACMLLFAYLVFLPQVHTSDVSCPTQCQLARSQGYWKNHCDGSLCDDCTASGDSAAAKAAVVAGCKSYYPSSKITTITACMTQKNPSCWTQLSALLLDSVNCGPDAKVQNSAVYSTDALRSVSSSCSYLPAGSKVSLQGLFSASLTKAQSSCTAVMGCLGTVLGKLDDTCEGRKWLECGDAGVEDDPIFVGFNNYRYEFHGVAGNVYNLLSEQDTQLNAQMMSVEDDAHNDRVEPGTFLGAVAFQYHTDRVLVRPVFGSKLDVTVNGIHMELPDLISSAQNTLPDGTMVKLWSRSKHVADIVQVSTPKLNFAITATGHHLDLKVNRINGDLCDVHGALGQTFSGQEYDNTRPAPTDFKVEGTDEDYKVSGMFGSDFKFNRFGKQPSHCYEQVVRKNSGKLAEILGITGGKGPSVKGINSFAQTVMARRRKLSANIACVGAFGDENSVRQCGGL